MQEIEKERTKQVKEGREGGGEATKEVEEERRWNLGWKIYFSSPLSHQT
jgi:hypothetical protein